jgi:hypothetical protein
MEKKEKEKWKKVSKQDSIGKTNFFLSTLPFSPWAILATWLHIGALHKIEENELSTHFEQNFTTGSYRAWFSHKTCEICSSLV